MSGARTVARTFKLGVKSGGRIWALPHYKSRQQIALREDILELCRETLPRHKVPAAISFVAALKVAATGKLVRRQ
jgi:acyl-coenzyme A synthetase/AMP-(fatty) acid ligase